MKIYDYPKIDLDRPGEMLQIAARLDWAMLLHLAKVGGWQPAGEGKHFGYYLQPSGSKVNSAEAYAIACALEAILDDIPDFDIPAQPRIPMFEFFSGRRKQEVHRVIDFCHGGAFRIT